MAKLNGPLHSLDATGTIADTVTYTTNTRTDGRRTFTARLSMRAAFRAPRVPPPATPAQLEQRAALTAATAYAKNPPPQDIDAIRALAARRALPFFQAASAYHFAHPAPGGNTQWDAGATIWDNGTTQWDT